MIDIDSSWQTELQETMNEEYFTNILKIISNPETDIIPSKENVFLALKLTPLANVKVVLLGQDPYPTKGHAHGLAFSVSKDISPLPKSLQNIFKELQSDLGVQCPKNGNLEHWAKQGVLLLNSFLTIENGKALSHKDIHWEKFTDKILQTVSQKKSNVVFIFLGSYAKSKESLIDSNKHMIIKTSHPSFFSANKGFFGSKIFSRANEYLKNTNQETINFTDN